MTRMAICWLGWASPGTDGDDDRSAKRTRSPGSARLTITCETVVFHTMIPATASIRELRTDFRAVKRKIEAHGEIIITDHGEPAYVVRPVVRQRQATHPMPDYHARVLRRQPKAMSEADTRRFHEENRGEC